MAENGFEGKSCRLIEVARGVKNRNEFISLDALNEWRATQPSDEELYSSFFRYYTKDPNVGGVLAGFGMDFDCVEKPEKAQKEALTIVKFFIDRFNVKEEDVSIDFSGNKGFHVFVNHNVFGLEPHYYLPQIFKEMARELIRQHNLKTLDLAIYDRRRLIRLPRSRHGKSGLFKTALTISELENLSLDQIKALATKPRQVRGRVEHKISDRAKAWYEGHRDAFMKRLEERKVEFVESDLNYKGLLPCVKKRLELGAEEGMRNKYTWQLASYFCKKGTPLEECLKILREWYSRIERGLDPYTWEECEDTIRATYQKRGYGIGCGSEYVEGLCVGKENCPLFVEREESEIPEEAYREAEEILLKDPLEYVADAVNKIHVGDREIIQIAYVSALSAQLAKSINLWPIGTSQKGKSHTLYSTLHVLPRELYETFTSASPLSLFYSVKKYGEDYLNGRLLFIDEVESSKIALPMLRSLTGPTDITPRHLSLDDKRDLLDLKIKGPRVVWFTSVKSIGDEQIRNRFIFVNPDESQEQDEAVFELQKKGIKIEEIRELQIAQAMTSKIIEETKGLEVKIPYIDLIEWPYKDRRWLFPLFKSFVEITTKIHYRQRERKGGEILSTAEDFEKTKALWGSCLEHIIYRVSQPAKKLLDEIPESEDLAKTKSELAEATGYSTRHISNLLLELEELTNSKKDEHGRVWVYWRARAPGVKDVRLRVGEMEIGNEISTPKNILEKNEDAKTDFLFPIHQELEPKTYRLYMCDDCAAQHREAMDLGRPPEGALCGCGKPATKVMEGVRMLEDEA